MPSWHFESLYRLLPFRFFCLVFVWFVVWELVCVVLFSGSQAGWQATCEQPRTPAHTAPPLVQKRCQGGRLNWVLSCNRVPFFCNKFRFGFQDAEAWLEAPADGACQASRQGAKSTEKGTEATFQARGLHARDFVTPRFFTFLTGFLSQLRCDAKARSARTAKQHVSFQWWAFPTWQPMCTSFEELFTNCSKSSVGGGLSRRLQLATMSHFAQALCLSCNSACASSMEDICCRTWT